MYRNDVTAENAEDAEGEKREMNNSDADGIDITFSCALRPGEFLKHRASNRQVKTGFLSRI
ncbi:MAG: hypothetical protein EAZ60_07220 [Oscillatoriales cyanobacterium]|nr:MAG: hypothetical protein EAZ83_07080 [Oscillatoriales cyanobacterium]TAE94023.1 MAG: hypothetical protein EAZ79_25005 [Oscillatoriales cyanobacterium]TAF38221.1 MAG: hypothetical protein EAZ69_04975 [Oscillatoriales cyanobacterium]TAF57364.1 MAG: hypothetical protein EAZ60_07220 [Oscillatoriales cyanobacterium]